MNRRILDPAGTDSEETGLQTEVPAAPGPGSCPACGRFIGPVDECPYCGVDSLANPGLRLLRAGALILAIGGLACLFLVARTREIPMVRIADITPEMNFAMVRVNGEITRAPYVGNDSYLSFPVSDGSGELRITAYGNTARGVMDLPLAKGARVTATGSVNVAADGTTRLRLNAVRQIQVDAPAGSPSRRDRASGSTRDAGPAP